MNKEQLFDRMKARLTHPTGDYAADLATKEQHEAAVKAASDLLKEFPRNAAGITPDAIKASPEYQQAKMLYDAMFKRLQTYNTIFLKQHKAQYMADRSKRRAVTAAPKRPNAIPPGLKSKVDEAAILGTKAFNDGKKCIPAQDAKLMQLLKGLPVGGGGTIIMKAWSDAWHKQNLKAPVEAVAGAARIDDIEHTVRHIFKKAGLPLERKDTVTARRRSVGGYVIVINSSHKSISFKSLMRLRAYLLHRFKSKQLTTSPQLVNGKPMLKYTITVKQIKRDKNGAHKLEQKTKPAAPAKKPAAVPAKKSNRVTAALARMRAYVNRNTQAA